MIMVKEIILKQIDVLRHVQAQNMQTIPKQGSGLSETASRVKPSVEVYRKTAPPLTPH
jgi:hypothetical protein